MRDDDAAACEQFFAALVQRHSRFVFQVAFAILRNSHDAEDVAQETFLRIYRNAAWKEMRDERAFLARTAWRIAVDRLPMRGAERRRVETAAVEFPALEPGPELSIIRAEKVAAVQRLIDALPEELRQPLALSTVEELGSREIAEVMGIAEGTVRSRLSRARQILKQKLERYG